MMSKKIIQSDAPVFIHIHGGYWQEESITHNINSFIAKYLHKYNIKSIYIGYELCPKVTLQQIFNNIEKAVTKCLEYARKHKSRGLHLSGHSAGAHLVAGLFENFIPSLPKEDKILFKSAFLLCGVYDLVPLITTQINIPLKLDETSAKAASPIYQNLSADGTVFYVVAAEHDSPAFVEQAKKMTEHLLSLGIKTDYVFISNVDHFDIIEKLIEEEYELSKLLINVINN
ncbi:hypothetical protein NQ314_001694 [Rhamnusium bicolor]|uniref:Alpha/beta hydrolase fold-3 domain-containing protein n=1 Tax=Rhamnusium bicolor TaxID=1586634 RepID=A0AAV8ZTG7_9CUCU|nr:hypothetical protein NQ314_001694 [Rhamnusium bicolor]